MPANTSSPAALATGSGSPVMVAWSTSLAPSTTSPSAPIRSPGRTSDDVPDRQAAASHGLLAPSSGAAGSRCSGARSSRPRTESAVRWVATASSAPEVAKMTISSAAVEDLPDRRRADRGHDHQQVHVQGLAPAALAARPAPAPSRR